MSVEGVKCLLTCRCILSQYKNFRDPPFHQFVAFAVVNDGVVQPKLVQCNNCGVLHRVTELCKTDILSGNEDSAALITINDIRACLGENIVSVLDGNNADLPTWELVQFIVENERWGDHAVLSSESISGQKQGKLLRILGKNLVKVESFMTSEVF